MQNHSSTCIMWLLSQQHIASRLYQSQIITASTKGNKRHTSGPITLLRRLICNTLWFFFAVCFFSDLKKRGCDFRSACRQSSPNRSVSSPTTIAALFAAESTAVCTIRSLTSLSAWRIFTLCSCSLELSKTINLCLCSHLDRKCSSFVLRGILPTKSTLPPTKPLVQRRCAVRLVPRPALCLSNTTLLLNVLYIAFPYGVKGFHGIR